MSRTSTNEDPASVLALCRDRLAHGHLVKALHRLRTSALSPSLLKADIDACVKDLKKRGACGVVLSGIYEYNFDCPYSVKDLLHEMFARRDYPGFLKQVYRFDAYSSFPKEVEGAIQWHEAIHRNDAVSWRMKFAVLDRQVQLQSPKDGQVILVADDDTSEVIAPAPLRLLELRRSAKKPEADPLPQPGDDEYVVSRAARVKHEQANQAHQATLLILADHLLGLGHKVHQNKLIDAYCMLPSGPVIFEVKSITESNEREQLRAAISQLYEYRFLHGVPNARLCIVTSHCLASPWFQEYLVKDRNIGLLWVADGLLSGPSLGLVAASSK